MIGPNPNKGSFTIRQNKAYNLREIQIYDPYGKEVTKITGDLLQNSEVPVRIDDPSAGMYLVNLITSQGVITKKVMIQK